MRSSAVLCSIALLLTLSAVRAQTDASAATNPTTSAPPAGGFPSPGQNSTNSPTDSVDSNSALNSTLREVAISRNVHFGFGVTGAEAANKTFAENASAHATMIGFQNETTLSVLQPTKGTYDFSGFDNVVKFAKANEIKVRAGPIFSSASVPSWMCNATAPNGRCKKAALSRGALWVALKDHLESVVKHLVDLNGGVNGTTVYSLDVVSGVLATNIWKKADGRLVNPFVPVNVDGYDVRLNRDIFFRSFGQKYVASMFKWARQAAPAKWRLFVSEKGFDLLNEQQGRAFFIWLQNMISNGVPIDGVNLQFTQPLKHTFHRRAFRQLVTKLIDRLNIEVHVTELQADPAGVDSAPGEYIEAQGGVYAKIAQSCLSIKGCRAVLFPSYADRASDPFTRALFTAGFAPRTAVGAVFNAIQSVKPQPKAEDVPASSQELPDAGQNLTAAAQESATTEAPAAETPSDSSKRGYWWTAEAPLDPLVPTPCSSDKGCCAGAKCLPSKTGKFCFLADNKPCPRCKFGFHYKHGVCFPDSNPCATDPCASTEANPRTETVCLYEPKQCITQPCPQFKCVAPKPHPCPFNAQYDRKFGICSTKEVRRVDSRECKQCVFCSQIIPRCYPPCRNDEYCEITPQSCADCAAARCVPRPIKRFIFEVEQFMPEVPDTLENDPAYYNCVLCPQVPSRCPVCAENEHCEMSPQTCGHCAHMKCVGNTPAASC